MLKLYTHPLSTFARRVEIALREKNIECERVVLDMQRRAHRAPEYLALHPYGRVPTLVDGDFVLPESTPILEYLEALHPQPALMPADAQGRALTSLHMKLCDIELTPHAYKLVFPKRFIPKEKWRLSEMAAASEAIATHLAVLDRQLQGRDFLVGDRFSLADLCYAPFLHFMDLLDVQPGENVARWAQSLAARPSVKATVPAM